MELELENGKVSIKSDGRLVAAYNYSQELYKPYFHPISLPSGDVVTDDSPVDHPHHRGLCVSWGDVNGVNFWAETAVEESKRGRIVHREFDEDFSVNENSAGMSVKNHWISPSGEVLLEEYQRFKIYKPTDESQIIDISFEFWAFNSDVTLGTPPAYHGLCFRAAHMDNTKTINSNGIIGEEHNHGKAAKWCDVSGILVGMPVGFTIFDHPKNLRFPTKFFTRDQNYGFISTSFAFDTPYLLPKNERLRLNHRVMAHMGDVYSIDIDAEYEKFAK